MTLENIASVTAGQIMTRVTADKDAGEQVVESVKVLVPKAIVSGVIVKEDLGDAELGKQIDEEKYTQEGDVVIKLSTPYDAAYVNEENAGIAIPSFCAAIRITELNMKDMQDIGKAFVLSGLKKATLQEMIDNETKLMENVVLASIKEGIGNED